MSFFERAMAIATMQRVRLCLNHKKRHFALLLYFAVDKLDFQSTLLSLDSHLNKSKYESVLSLH